MALFLISNERLKFSNLKKVVSCRIFIVGRSLCVSGKSYPYFEWFCQKPILNFTDNVVKGRDHFLVETKVVCEQYSDNVWMLCEDKKLVTKCYIKMLSDSESTPCVHFYVRKQETFFLFIEFTNAYFFTLKGRVWEREISPICWLTPSIATRARTGRSQKLHLGLSQSRVRET